MKKEEIHLWDVQRILFGQAPPSFLLEVFVRALIVYAATILVMRWMGKRMNGQLSIIEMSVMLMMGAIISVPMQIPDRGIAQGLLVLLVTLACFRGINWLSFKSVRVEKLVQGDVITLIKDGVLQLPELKKTKISNQQVFLELRTRHVLSLGKVKRMYLEADGNFSVYEAGEARPGLPIVPPDDEALFNQTAACSTNDKACIHCGTVTAAVVIQCPYCHKKQFSKVTE